MVGVGAEALVEMGRFGRPHGVRGELRFWANNLESALVREAGRAIAVGDEPARVVPHRVESVRFDAQGPVVRLEGVNTRDAAAALTGHRWFEPRSAFPAVAEDEVYLVDLVGLPVRTVGGHPLGTVADVMFAAGARLLVVREGAREVLVPHVPAIVRAIETGPGGHVLIDAPEGLCDALGG